MTHTPVSTGTGVWKTADQTTLLCFGNLAAR